MHVAMNVTHQAQHVVVGATGVVVGGGGVVVNFLIKWEPAVQLFMTFGSLVLFFGSAGLMVRAYIHWWNNRNRERSREGDR